MIVLVGESGSGKSTLEKELSNKYGMKKIVSYTTRPIRKGEINGKDYHFVETEYFEQLKEQGYFVETASYNQWQYGIAKNELTDDSIAVLTPKGLRSVQEYNEKNNAGLDIISIYINVDQRSRLIKLLERGDDINESYRRNISDLGMFDGIEDDVLYVIKNYEYRYNPSQMLVIADHVLEDHHINLYHKYYGYGEINE